ncbi:trimeric intracellular cation channel family protein [Streptococcus sp. zg-86]|uniref:Trimeric intracellular cation channel family protein n=1 Tax=Streptococcus zhangguiae TaxID=2664091 RepID=A0A6I4RHZ5_9STRE|nr:MULTISPECIES: trimeric intracellular cation channel family protein [unclassified Streptococcus]MTB65052.1 trimeric intracellular cation channel family protein [Streptococcus sp. zg-86]MTB91261.1 trimeric intracellular cation channel family protein [Streptococcus sp. zg-36]MWV57034.1 trimeric intracellular cation channel family protein [Streptococcus sp. zg-70]QTH47545.1 trimeric intracellular cation channel family protein [Streptococcus sp. zg-86]
MDFDLFLLICNYIGTISFAVSGTIKGFKKKLDIFGITLLATITAIGGGVIRDTMVNQIPAALVEPSSIYLSIVVSIIMYLFVIMKKNESPRDKTLYHFLSKTNLVFDAIGLVIFALIGASTGVELGLNGLTSGILAALTGVGGGIVRDLLVNETPLVLKEDVYAVLALFTGISYHILVLDWKLARIPTFISLFFIFLLIRLLVIKYHLNLPNMEKPLKKR